MMEIIWNKNPLLTEIKVTDLEAKLAYQAYLFEEAYHLLLKIKWGIDQTFPRMGDENIMSEIKILSEEK